MWRLTVSATAFLTWKSDTTCHATNAFWGTLADLRAIIRERMTPRQSAITFASISLRMPRFAVTYSKNTSCTFPKTRYIVF